MGKRTAPPAAAAPLDPPANPLSAREALQSLAQQTLEEFLTREPNVSASSGSHPAPLPQGEELEDLRFQLTELSYDMYADLSPNDRLRFGQPQQEELLDQLNHLASEGRCQLRAQGTPECEEIDDKTPEEARQINPGAALRAHYYLLRPGKEGLDTGEVKGAIARLSLCVHPAHVASVARRLVDLYAVHGNALDQMKITAPAEQGIRRDSIVIYLRGVDPELAAQIADDLQQVTETAAWRPFSPIGMHSFRTGISYGEVSEYSGETSFGADRAALVADAIIAHLGSSETLEAQLNAQVWTFGYSTDNPAFIERTRRSPALVGAEL